MDQSQALARLRQIVDGIDREECHLGDGWWETSVGAEFGAARLSELEDLVRELTQ